MTEVRTPNLPELKRLNMWVQEQDQLEPGARIWDQGNWVALREETPMCQTAYCVAGMAITRAGHSLTSKVFTVVNKWEWEDDKAGETIEEYTWTYLDGERKESWQIEDFAAEVLGIDSTTAADLFWALNSASMIDKHIRDIFFAAGASYDATEPAPNFEIEIKAKEAAQQHLKFTNIKEEALS